MKSWEEILGYRQLTASYRAMSSLQDLFFTNNFYKSPKPIYGDTVEMISVSATNVPGPLNSKGAAARVIQPKGGTKRAFSLFHYFTELPLDPWAFMSLRSMESEELQNMGREVMEIQLEEAAQKHRIAKEVILSNIFAYNRVNLDADGTILTPSVHATTGVITDASGTAVSADFGVADAHRGNLGGTIGAQWSTTSTDIALHLDTLDRKAGIAGVPKIRHIYVNGLNKTHLIANTKFNDMAKYANVMGLMDKSLNNIPDDSIEVFGKVWHFVNSTWTDASGTTRDLIPSTLAIMLPEDRSWIRPFTGRTPVPTAAGIASAASPLEDFKAVEGEYAYAYTNHNPVRTSVFTGDTFGMGFANPDAIWVGKVFT